MLKKVSRTSLHVAKIAALRGKTTVASPHLVEKCSLQFALLAASRRKFPSSPKRADRFIAVIAFPGKDNLHKNSSWEYALRRTFFIGNLPCGLLRGKFLLNRKGEISSFPNY